MMNNQEVLVDFDPGVPIVEITGAMHGLMSWQGNSMDAACTMSGKNILLGMLQSIEGARIKNHELEWEQQTLRSKQASYREQMLELLEEFNEHVR